MVKSEEIVQMNTPPHPYNEITSVKSLADIVGTEGDKSGFFKPQMTRIERWIGIWMVGLKKFPDVWKDYYIENGRIVSILYNINIEWSVHFF
jgi:hypothetical protein